MRRTITLSRGALEHNLRLIAARRPISETRLDLRADAYGHGEAQVAAVAREVGFSQFVLSPTSGETDADCALLYGVAPAALPVMTVTGEVVAVKRVPAGSPVSYGYTYRVAEAGSLALVGLGYADGVPRTASSRADAAVGGRRCRVAGRIAMDQLMLDIGDLAVRRGDPVVLWGDGGAPSVGEWAERSGFSPLSLTAGLGPRFSREWLA